TLVSTRNPVGYEYGLPSSNRWSEKGELAPRYMGPFNILEQVEPVAYHLRLPQELSSIHDMLHVSNLNKCLADTDFQVPLEEIKIDNQLHLYKNVLKLWNRKSEKISSRLSTPIFSHKPRRLESSVELWGPEFPKGG
nr:hypothetical protein [Tanacetum cinerariifolium]